MVPASASLKLWDKDRVCRPLFSSTSERKPDLSCKRHRDIVDSQIFGFLRVIKVAHDINDIPHISFFNVAVPILRNRTRPLKRASNASVDAHGAHVLIPGSEDTSQGCSRLQDLLSNGFRHIRTRIILWFGRILAHQPAVSVNGLNNKENNHECDTNTHSISFNHIHICRIYSNDSTQWVHIVIIGIWCVYLIQEFTQYIPQDRPRKQQKRSSRNAKHRMVLSKLMGSWSTMLAMVSSVPNGAKMVPKCGLASSFVRHCAAQVA